MEGSLAQSNITISAAEAATDQALMDLARVGRRALWTDLAHAYATSGEVFVATRYIDQAIAEEPEDPNIKETKAFVLIKVTEHSPGSPTAQGDLQQ
jgi:predicted Zn-dependent protease